MYIPHCCVCVQQMQWSCYKKTLNYCQHKSYLLYIEAGIILLTNVIATVSIIAKIPIT